MKEYFGPYLQKFGLKQIPELDERPENLSKILNTISEQSIQTKTKSKKMSKKEQQEKK